MTVMNHGPELAARAVARRVRRRGARTDFVQPESPIENTLAADRGEKGGDAQVLEDWRNADVIQGISWPKK